MDRPAHTRFLTYLETWDYFREPGQKRLGRDDWSQLDAELEGLLAEEAQRPLEPEETRRKAALAQALMRD